MVVNALRLIYEENQDKDHLLVRNLLKERIQLFVLNFVYNSAYGESFIFKGGTCLRFCFGLPRLSEDLDFDIGNEKRGFEKFSHPKFCQDLKTYFEKKLKFKEFSAKISGKNKIIYLKLPILAKIGFPVDKEKISENVLFVRIDLSPAVGKFLPPELSLKSTSDFSFIIKRYTLSDLFAGKIAAILTREALEGKKLKPRFKGRDYFDLFWFLEKGVKPNYSYLLSISKISSKEKLLRKLKQKLEQARGHKEELRNDLSPFFEDKTFVDNFVKNFNRLVESFLAV